MTYGSATIAFFYSIYNLTSYDVSVVLMRLALTNLAEKCFLPDGNVAVK